GIDPEQRAGATRDCTACGEPATDISGLCPACIESRQAAHADSATVAAEEPVQVVRSTGAASEPCVGCGTPIKLRINGRPWHEDCFEAAMADRRRKEES